MLMKILSNNIKWPIGNAKFTLVETSHMTGSENATQTQNTNAHQSPGTT